MRKISRILLVTTSVAAVLLTAACSAGVSDQQEADSAQKLAPLSEIEPLADPTSFDGPTTAVIPKAKTKPIVSKPKPKLPATVTSHTSQGDSKVKVSSVDRVLALSLSGSLAEYVYTLGMGDSLVGKDVSTDFPGSGDLPLVTHEGHSIDPEAVLNLDPTLIITDGSIGPIDVVEQLADAGVPVVFVDGAETFEQSYTQAQQIADALGVSAVADKVVSELKEAIAKKEKEIARLVPADENKRPRVAFLYMRGKGVFYLFGEGSGVDSLFKSEQVTDVAKEINWKGQRPMNDEALVKANPDTILVMTGGLKSVGGIDGMLETHPAVALTDAGKNKRIIDVDDTSLFTGGMRVPDILDGLARAFYAPDTLQ